MDGRKSRTTCFWRKHLCLQPLYFGPELVYKVNEVCWSTLLPCVQLLYKGDHWTGSSDAMDRKFNLFFPTLNSSQKGKQGAMCA